MEVVEEMKRSVVHRYRFPEQTHEIGIGDSPKNPDTAESDDLKRGSAGRWSTSTRRPAPST